MLDGADLSAAPHTSLPQQQHQRPGGRRRAGETLHPCPSPARSPPSSPRGPSPQAATAPAGASSARPEEGEDKDEEEELAQAGLGDAAEKPRRAGRETSLARGPPGRGRREEEEAEDDLTSVPVASTTTPSLSLRASPARRGTAGAPARRRSASPDFRVERLSRAATRLLLGDVQDGPGASSTARSPAPTPLRRSARSALASSSSSAPSSARKRGEAARKAAVDVKPSARRFSPRVALMGVKASPRPQTPSSATSRTRGRAPAKPAVADAVDDDDGGGDDDDDAESRGSSRSRNASSVRDDEPEPRVVNDESSLDDILHSSWQLLNFFLFCKIYREVFGLPKFTLPDLEQELTADIRRRTSGVRQDQGEDSGKLSIYVIEIMIRLLNHLRHKKNPIVTLDNWELFLKSILDSPEDKDLFPEELNFVDLRLPSRIRLMHHVTELVFQNGLAEISKASIDPQDQRVLPIGTDKKGRQYWMFTENRVYMDRTSKRDLRGPLADYPFALVASKVEEWESLVENLRKSRVRTEKTLAGTLSQFAEKAIASIRAREKELTRQLYLDSLPKKRSERIVAKQAAEEERQKLEELRREQAAAQAALKLEEKRIKDEERKQRLMSEAAEEKRRLASMKAEKVARQRMNAERQAKEKELVAAAERALDAEVAEIWRERGISAGTMPQKFTLDALSRQLVDGEDKPVVIRFSKSTAAHNSPSLTGGRGPGSVPTLCEYWLEAEVNNRPMSPILKLCSREMLDELMRMDAAWPFLEPVDPVELDIPTYFDEIKEPMDFGTMRRKIVCGEYPNFREFCRDLRRVFDNCIKFNRAKSDYSQMARKVEKEVGRIMDACGFVTVDESFVPVGFVVPDPASIVPSKRTLSESSMSPEEATRTSSRPRRLASAQNKNLNENEMQWSSSEEDDNEGDRKSKKAKSSGSSSKSKSAKDATGVTLDSLFFTSSTPGRTGNSERPSIHPVPPYSNPFIAPGGRYYPTEPVTAPIYQYAPAHTSMPASVSSSSTQPRPVAALSRGFPSPFTGQLPVAGYQGMIRWDAPQVSARDAYGRPALSPNLAVPHAGYSHPASAYASNATGYPAHTLVTASAPYSSAPPAVAFTYTSAPLFAARRPPVLPDDQADPARLPPTLKQSQAIAPVHDPQQAAKTQSAVRSPYPYQVHGAQEPVAGNHLAGGVTLAGYPAYHASCAQSAPLLPVHAVSRPAAPAAQHPYPLYATQRGLQPAAPRSQAGAGPQQNAALGQLPQMLLSPPVERGSAASRLPPPLVATQLPARPPPQPPAQDPPFEHPQPLVQQQDRQQPQQLNKLPASLSSLALLASASAHVATYGRENGADASNGSASLQYIRSVATTPSASRVEAKAIRKCSRVKGKIKKRTKGRLASSRARR